MHIYVGGLMEYKSQKKLQHMDCLSLLPYKLVKIFCFLNNENPSRIAEVRRILVQKRSNSLVNLLCHLVRSKIDFLGTSNFLNS